VQTTELTDGAYSGSIQVTDASGPPGLSIPVGLSLFAVGQSSGWLLQTVEPASNGITDQTTSLAFDPQGQPAITAMRDDATFTKELRYHHWNGCGWDSENVATWGLHSSLAFDRSGQPHIGFLNELGPNLHYASRSSQGWSIVTVEDQGPAGNTGQWPSMVLDAIDQPRISYLLKYQAGDIFTYDLRYGSFDGTGWTLETVATERESGWNSSLALNAAGQPRISYYQDSFFNVNFAEWLGDHWQIQTIEQGGRKSSLRLDSSDRPRVAYHGITPSALVKFAYRDAAEWQTETIDQQLLGGDGLAAVCLALDKADTPHVAYSDAGTGTLKYATRMGPNDWAIDVVDKNSTFGSGCALQFDRLGVPHISYIDIAQQTLKHAQGPTN